MQHKKKEEREHELLSVAIFKQILRNPKVLAEFVEEGLSSEDVQLIGEMIRPEEIVDQENHPNYKRLFLYEVCHYCKVTLRVLYFNYCQW